MDDTIIYRMDENLINEKEIEILGNGIREGKTVCFPTETVYGIGANALDENAVLKIFKAKGRPQDNPLIIHVCDKNIEKYVKEVPDIAKKLIDAFWPGPLTIILEKKDIIPLVTSAGLSTIGIRMPRNEIARKIIEKAKVPIAAPSANISGRPSATNIERCIEDLFGKVDYITGNSSSEIGLESTIIDVSVYPPVILRPGYITIEDLKKVDESIEIEKIEDIKNEKPKAPGMKYRHYAPKAIMKLYEGNTNEVEEDIKKDIMNLKMQGFKVGVLTFEDKKNSFDADVVYSLGDRKDIKSGINKLYETLRLFDDNKVEYILSENYEKSNETIAIINRLKKASLNEVMNIRRNDDNE